MVDVAAVTQEESLAATPQPPRNRKRRFGFVALSVTAALGLGLAGGANMQRLMNFDQATTWVVQTASALQPSLEAARVEISRRVASFGSRPASVAQAGPEPTSEPSNNNDPIERAVADLMSRVDQVRAATDSSARDLSAGIERVHGSAEQNHRELVAKLAQLAERVERIERQAAAAAATTTVAQPVAQQTASSPPTPPVKPTPQPALQTQAKATPKPMPPKTKLEMPGIEAKGIANWTVRDVFDGTAVLDGPRGLVEVSPGDIVPGIGQVRAIVRSGQRWIVATTKGVITPH